MVDDTGIGPARALKKITLVLSDLAIRLYV
jgi:hypothetical protein